MNDIHLLIKNYKNDGDEIYLVQIIERFKPLIQKYSRLLKYEDAENELIEHLIICIKNIPLTTEGKQVNYIVQCVKNKYIYLSKRSNKLKNEISSNLIDIKPKRDSINPIIIEMYMAIDELPKEEKSVIINRYFYGYSDKEISKFHNVSRQAVNKLRRKALKTLRKRMEEVY
ncbi:glycosylating toxin sigma factor TcdR [Vallitalea sediminicola]